MMKTTWMACAALALVGCGSNDAEKFVGTWAWASTAKASVTCGTMTFDNPLGSVVETFTLSDDVLSKTDSQGCGPLLFTATGMVASMHGVGQSCAIPAGGGGPAATFAPSFYTFTMSSDERSLTAAITATYTPMGGSACTVSASGEMLAKK